MEAPEFLKPLLDELPEGIRAFMNEGGWLIVAGVLGLLVLLILWKVIGALFRKPVRKPAADVVPLAEDLSTYPVPPPLWGNRQLLVHSLPVRLRLVVIAPLGLEAQKMQTEEVEKLLDHVVPGLGSCVKADKPRIRIWPTQLSQQGFIAAFRRHTLVPDAEHDPSRWILVMGRIIVDRRPLGVGFAFQADKPSTLGKISVEHPHQWAETVRVKTA